MARVQSSSRGSDLRAQFIARGKGTSFFQIEAWMPSEIKAISPLVDRLMRLIEGSHCVAGNEYAVELALREAVNNAVTHGNGMDARKLVQVRCRCELGHGVSLIISDQGRGFDAGALPDPLAIANLEAEHGRGIHLMKSTMDEVSFECGGTEVHMWKGPARNSKTELRSNNEAAPSLISTNSSHRGAAGVETGMNPLRRRQR
jgi:anti-sigma regulatory factor (Ser/Thr protein kinase)